MLGNANQNEVHSRAVRPKMTLGATLLNKYFSSGPVIERFAY